MFILLNTARISSYQSAVTSKILLFEIVGIQSAHLNNQTLIFHLVFALKRFFSNYEYNFLWNVHNLSSKLFCVVMREDFWDMNLITRMEIGKWN